MRLNQNPLFLSSSAFVGSVIYQDEQNQTRNVHREKLLSNPIGCAGHMLCSHCPQSRVCTTGRLCGLGRGGWVFFSSSILIISSRRFPSERFSGRRRSCVHQDDESGAWGVSVCFRQMKQKLLHLYKEGKLLTPPEEMSFISTRCF